MHRFRAQVHRQARLRHHAQLVRVTARFREQLRRDRVEPGGQIAGQHLRAFESRGFCQHQRVAWSRARGRQQPVPPRLPDASHHDQRRRHPRRDLRVSTEHLDVQAARASVDFRRQLSDGRRRHACRE